MLVVILGASNFPKASRLAAGRLFYDSAADFRDYLTDQNGLAVQKSNIQWLFDDNRAAGDQLEDIASFLDYRTNELKRQDSPAQDMLLYYVGHGLFARGGQTFCLAVRSTNENNEGATSIRAIDLASVLRDNATFLRRYLILDCCFSAVFSREFLSAPLEAARTKLKEDLPTRGTTLLCSSSSRDASLAPQNLGRTMFSSALVKVLREGHPSLGAKFSISELGDAVIERLRNEHENWVRPEVHSPDLREGDIANIRLFPNHAYGREKEPFNLEKAEQRVKEQEVKERQEREQRAKEQEVKERQRIKRRLVKAICLAVACVGLSLVGVVLAARFSVPPPPPPIIPVTYRGRRVKHEGGLQTKVLLNRVDPHYPPLARQARIQGTVKLHAIIAEDGSVKDLQEISGHPLFFQAALDAVRQWRYRPTILDNEFVEVDTMIEVIFSLDH